MTPRPTPPRMTTLRTIHPSMKAVWPAYIIAAILYFAAVWAYFHFQDEEPRWLLALPLVVFLIPLRMHLMRRCVTLRFDDGDHLTLESGFLSRTRRTIDMAKIQDVTVRQTFGQRLRDVGALMRETGCESGSIAIANLDSPRMLADEIIAGSKRSPGAGIHHGLG